LGKGTKGKTYNITQALNKSRMSNPQCMSIEPQNLRS